MGLQITDTTPSVCQIFSLPGTALRVSHEGCSKLVLETLSTELEKWSEVKSLDCFSRGPEFPVPQAAHNHL